MIKHCRSIFLLAAVSLLLASCCKKRVYCTKGNVDIAFSGFPRTESRTVMLTRYKVGYVDTAIDSALFTYTGSKPSSPNKRDTLYFSEYSSSKGFLTNNITAGNDWTVKMVGPQRVFRITQISTYGKRFIMEKCDEDGSSCVDEVAGFGVNGVTWVEGNRFFITR